MRAPVVLIHYAVPNTIHHLSLWVDLFNEGIRHLNSKFLTRKELQDQLQASQVRVLPPTSCGTH